MHNNIFELHQFFQRFILTFKSSFKIVPNTVHASQLEDYFEF